MPPIINFFAVSLTWLIKFKQRILSGTLGNRLELVVATEDFGTHGNGFNFKAGATIIVESYDKQSSTCVGSLLYGQVRRGEFPFSCVARKSRENWTTEDICEFIIKPECIIKQCAYVELLMDDDVSKLETQGSFVSHPRQCRFVDLVDALENFFILKDLEFSNEYVWLDIFCANQPKLSNQSLPETVWKEQQDTFAQGLHTAIATLDRSMIFVDKWHEPTALTRAWCIWEILGIVKANKQIHLALTVSEHLNYIYALENDEGRIGSALAKLDVEHASCFSPIDLNMIHTAIKAESSYKEINCAILTQFRLWMSTTMMTQIVEEKGMPAKDMCKIVCYSSQVALVSKVHSHSVVDEQLFVNALPIHRFRRGP